MSGDIPWSSPFPVFRRGLPEQREELERLDEEISYLESMSLDLKKQRRQALSFSKVNSDPIFQRNLHSHFLTIVKNRNCVETELHRLQQERLKLVILADLAYDVSRRGEHFPWASLDDHLESYIYIQSINKRLLALSTVAAFGSGISASLVFSAERGNLGLVSLSFAAFTVAFMLAVIGQITMPRSNPDFARIVYPGIRGYRALPLLFYSIAVAFLVNLLFQGIATVFLDGHEPDVNAGISPFEGGIASVVSMSGFIWSGVRKTDVHSTNK